MYREGKSAQTKIKSKDISVAIWTDTLTLKQPTSNPGFFYQDGLFISCNKNQYIKSVIALLRARDFFDLWIKLRIHQAQTKSRSIIMVKPASIMF